jgi:hypothetical protein
MIFYRPCAAHPAASQEAAFIISGDMLRQAQHPEPFQRKSNKKTFMQRDKHQTRVFGTLIFIVIKYVFYILKIENRKLTVGIRLQACGVFLIGYLSLTGYSILCHNFRCCENYGGKGRIRLLRAFVGAAQSLLNLLPPRF